MQKLFVAEVYFIHRQTKEKQSLEGWHREGRERSWLRQRSRTQNGSEEKSKQQLNPRGEKKIQCLSIRYEMLFKIAAGK